MLRLIESVDYLGKDNILVVRAAEQMLERAVRLSTVPADG